MQNSILTFAPAPTRLDAVAQLPMAWRNLGSTMLGWIQRRAALPGIAESVRELRPRVAGSGESRLAAAPQSGGRDGLETLYQAWRSTRDGSCRRQILGDITRAFTPLIRATIRQYHVACLAGRADLEQEAFLGLHDALHKYDPARGVTLAGFVRWRIIGAILDARRRWMRQCRGWKIQCGTSDARQLCAPRINEPPATADHTVGDLEFEDFFDALGRGLSAREKLIVRMTVLEGKTCRQIGQFIGLHHARVGQLYRNAMETLRHNPRARCLLVGTG